MKRLLKIKEFFHLKRDLESDDVDTCSSCSSSRPAKRPRKNLTDNGIESIPLVAAAKSAMTRDDDDISRKRWRDRFLQLFENEVAKDIVWWLPGRRGEAFAMNRVRFEKELLKIHFQGHSFSTFLGNLHRWGFRQMNIPSLSGRVLTFEKNSQGVSGSDLSSFSQCASEASKSCKNNSTSSQLSRQQAPQNGSQQMDRALVNIADGGERQPGLSNSADVGSLQMQQAHYLLQQEIAHTYFSLLWQELQRQLTILLLQQAQTGPPVDAPQQQTTGNFAPSSASRLSRSTIADVASLLHQQQIQQQLVVAAFYRVALTEPMRPTDEPSVIRELNELHRQQMSNLTFQIVALVAANLEQQNQNPEHLQEESITHKVLVKYLIALVLLQLQQQQHNLEFLRQDRLTALALIRSLQRSPVADGIGGGDIAGASSIEASPQLLTSVQMQQLLAEAAMLSLSRAHQLLAEAAILMPLTVPQPQPQPQQPPPLAHIFPGALPHQDHLPDQSNFTRAGLPHGTSSTRTTAAR